MCRLTHNTYTIQVQYHLLSMCQGLMIQTILHYTPRKGVCQWGKISGTKHSRCFGCMLVMTLFVFWQVRKQVWMVLVYYSLQHFWGDPTYQSQGQRVQVLVNEGQSSSSIFTVCKQWQPHITQACFLGKQATTSSVMSRVKTKFNFTPHPKGST